MTDETKPEEITVEPYVNSEGIPISPFNLDDLVAVPTEAGVAAADDALAAIRERSFSGRNPSLGKMIKCQVCGFRHRDIERHTQRFAHRWTVIDGGKVYTDEELIAGQTPETSFDRTVEADIPAKQIRIMLGSAAFAKKRRKPPLNRRANRFVELVRSYTPDEYTHEELEKARSKARRVLSKTLGRHGFLPPIWQDTKKGKHETEEVAGEQAVQAAETDLPTS